jgi:hypothetical protein
VVLLLKHDIDELMYMARPVEDPSTDNVYTVAGHVHSHGATRHTVHFVLIWESEIRSSLV